jgi:nicotinate-nucleotide pyrophosphorylase (carboxylating)
MDAEIKAIVQLAIQEDEGDGDHSSLSCIPSEARGKATITCKEAGIIAGIELAEYILKSIDITSSCSSRFTDGDAVKPGDQILKIEGNQQLLLRAERLILNFMQRMSGIATLTHAFVQCLQGTHTRLLDTRKTTPGLRKVEKWAVRIGGGQNHRMGLYDCVMLKENHLHYAGGIQAAISNTQTYLRENHLEIPIEIETRNLEEVDEVLRVGGIHRIMLDNFSIDDLHIAIKKINGRFETEASGGITLESIHKIAATGVDYISVGALTHSAKSLDLSLLVEGIS